MNINKMKRGMEKRGLSPVVASVLIILITVVAAMIIAAFVIPWIGSIGDEGKACFDVIGDLAFHGTEYNCYSEDESLTGFSISVNSENIEGFILLAISGGRSDRYVITKDDTHSEKIKMLGNTTFTDIPLDVPTEGGIRTYVFNGLVDSFEIYPLLRDGKKCEMAGSLEPLLCTSDEVVICMKDGTC